jgi:hypothetical protein
MYRVDLKKIIGYLLTAGLALGIGYAAKQGVEIKCPSEQSAPASGK